MYVIAREYDHDRVGNEDKEEQIQIVAVVDVEQYTYCFGYHSQKQPNFKLVPYFVGLLVPVDAHESFIDDENALEKNK